MGGGLLQLIRYGVQDCYLVGDGYGDAIIIFYFNHRKYNNITYNNITYEYNLQF